MPEKKQVKFGVLFTGEGTNMEKILLESQITKGRFEVRCILSNRSQAGGLNRARNLEFPEKDIVVLRRQDCPGDTDEEKHENFGRQIVTEMHKRGVTHIIQAGWLVLTPKVVIDEFADRIFNQHPAPVPEFGGEGMYGIRAHAAVLNFVKMTEQEHPHTNVVIHRVTPTLDEGAVVRSAHVDILPDDNAETLQKRATEYEYRILRYFLYDILDDRVRENPLSSIVQPGQEELLAVAKKLAIEKYR